MTCASCAVSSESILKSQPGVVEVAVNYANATAQVEYVPTATDPHKLKAALQAIGYDLMIDESEEAKDELAELHKQKADTLKKKTIGSILLSIPTVINRNVLYEHTLCELHNVGFSNTSSLNFWKAVFYQCMETNKTSFC